ncbi:DinB family protein [Terrabacter sp. NPDC000476]|uniref:DinB family protein n=1 Tax=Terrabacter sp. NPDC000476 TaxID=3154258 RepID=UPI0033263D0D
MAEQAYEDRSGTAFERVRLTGATFEDVYLDGARLHDVDLRGASLRMVDLRGLRARDVWLEDVDITGDVENVRINGVDVAPLVEAELDRRDPDRARMRPTDAAGYREAWDVLERRWAATVERARSLDPELLHERVDGEWSFVETLRHLVFATDAWVARALLGDPEPWHPLDLPHDDMPDSPPVPRDRSARPSLEEVLALRAERTAMVRRVVDALTDEQLAGTTAPVTEPGYPEPEPYAVTRILRTILNEEWHHRLYAERDLDVLAPRSGDG